MIRVNLLPQDTRSKASSKSAAPEGPNPGGSPIVNVLSFLILVSCLGGASYGFYFINNEVSTRQTEEAKLKKEIQDAEREERIRGEEFRALQAKEKQALDRGRVLLTLDPPDRLLWAEKLNMLADLRPEGIAITKIELSEDVQMVTSPESAAEIARWEAAQREGANRNRSSSGGSTSASSSDSGSSSGGRRSRGGGGSAATKPREVKIPIITQTLTIEGIAYQLQQQQRLTDINVFRSALDGYFLTLPDRQMRRFMDGFKPSIARRNLAQINRYQGFERVVTSFAFSIETVPIGNVNSETLFKRLSEDLDRRRRAAEALETLNANTPAAPAAPMEPAAGSN